MDAQQLASDDDEQSSGYRCSGSPAGVQKCARALVHEQELVPDHAEDYDRICAVGAVWLLHGQHAGIQGRHRACRECATMVAMQLELLFARGERSNAWVDKIKEVGGAELHRDGAARVAQGQWWPWSVGRRADCDDGARVHEVGEAGEEDVEEEAHPGSNGRFRRGAQPPLGHGVGVKLGALPGDDRRKRRVEWKEEEV
ncbi:hypothetical protein VPH35_065951 [Triticum aestivum]